MIRRKYLIVVIAMLCALQVRAQEVFLEMSGTTSNGDFAPLWLSSNKQGRVSPYANSAYQRVGYQQGILLGKDGTDRWHLDWGADLMLSQNSQSAFMVHQLYGELSWKKLKLTIGQKERKIDLRNNRLTSGGLSQGINAQPIPEVLAELDYFSVPLTNHWWKMSYRLGYGKTTDGNWIDGWVDKEAPRQYTGNILYHEKALLWKISREDRFPLTFDIELQMQTQFGGMTYHRPFSDGYHDVPHAENLSAFWNALWPMGSEGETDGVIKNAAGNTIGSYNFALTWNASSWMMRAYYERMFEDQSMLTVQYGLFDHLLGVEAELPKNPFVSHIVIEHMSTKDQAGPVFHDTTANIPESYTGIDNYYNHDLYSGWQHWGMGIGHPLLTSPIYNGNHTMEFLNNRVQAWHIGIDGNPSAEWAWRLMATWTRNWGTYDKPFVDINNQQYYLAEATYMPQSLRGWQATLGLGIDHGTLIGNSTGAQLTIRKTFNLKK